MKRFMNGLSKLWVYLWHSFNGCFYEAREERLTFLVDKNLNSSSIMEAVGIKSAFIQMFIVIEMTLM